MKLQALRAETLGRAIRLYREVAYGGAPESPRGLDPGPLGDGDLEDTLSLFDKEMFEPIPGYPCVRYSLRLGNRNYPFMKLVLQEDLIAGEFFFAVNTHDQMDIRSDCSDYESWMAVRRFNHELKLQIEDAFAKDGFDTAASVRRAVQQRAAGTAVDGCRGTVLIVDDEADLAGTVELLLRRRGFRVFKILDGRAALPSVRELMPDLVLLDYELPDLDGLQVITQLRADEQTRHVAVLLASAAKVSLAEIQRADGFLAKPFQEALLYEMVDRVLRTRRAES